MKRILDELEHEALYDRAMWFVDEVLEADPATGRVVVRVDTTRLGPFVDAQRPIGGHPKHVPGAIMVQITGTLGQIQATCLRGLRPSEGWLGFGTVIRSARFLKMGEIGPPMLATATLTRAREFRGSWHLSSTFLYEQEGHAIYHSDQTATWFRRPGPG